MTRVQIEHSRLAFGQHGSTTNVNGSLTEQAWVLSCSWWGWGEWLINVYNRSNSVTNVQTKIVSLRGWNSTITKEFTHPTIRTTCPFFSSYKLAARETTQQTHAYLKPNRAVRLPPTVLFRIYSQCSNHGGSSQNRTSAFRTFCWAHVHAVFSSRCCFHWKIHFVYIRFHLDSKGVCAWPPLDVLRT